MKKVLVYENDKVNEYELVYDQEYMNICLEEYRKNFSLLRKGNILTSGKCSKDDVMQMIIYFNDVVSFGVSNTDTDDYFKVNFIGAINPTVYNILKTSDGEFDLDSKKMYALLSWCEALEVISDENKKFLPLSEAPIDDFFGLDEKKDTINNVCNLLDGVSLEYVGTKERISSQDLFDAKVGADFVKKFNLDFVEQKSLKK